VTLLDDTGSSVGDGPPLAEGVRPRFQVRLHNFEGPFDLLLQLIGKHELDITEMALHTVTDDFIAHLTALGDDADLDETTEFLVIAATLLDLKAARLLPDAEVEDAEDLALLEARDLLFARLLQYRAYKQVAALFVELEAGAMRRFPRSVALEERFAVLLPEVLLGLGVPAQAAAHRRARPPALREGVGGGARRAAAGAARRAGGRHLRRAHRRLRRPARGGRPVPRAAGAVPGGERLSGAAGAVRRADGTLESG
jgi:hypothetical protein